MMMSIVMKVIACWIILSVITYMAIVITKDIIRADTKSIIKTIVIVEVTTLLSSVIAFVI